MYINRIKDNFSRSLRISLVQSLVLSIVNHGIKLWGNTSATYVKKVQRIQKFAAKVALGGGTRQSPDTPFIKELGWLKIKQKYKYDLGILAFNIVTGRIPPHLFTQPLVCEVRATPARQRRQLHVSRANTSTGARSMLLEAPTLWNRLPPLMKNAPFIMSLKKLLRKHILDKHCND